MLLEDAEVPEGVELTDFEDYSARRKNLFDKAKDTFESQWPKEHNGVRIEMQNVRYEDPEHYDIRTQKAALHQDKYLARRLRADIVLTDTKTGDVLDSKPNTTVMRVPYLTGRGTFIHNGSELGTISQQRLIPGAYSRVQANGELETQYNVRPGTGSAFKVQFDPESTLYRFSMKGGNIPLYSLLHSIGVSDDELRDRWGEEVFSANAAKYDPSILDKAYTKIVPEWEKKKNPNPSREEKAAKIKDALNKAQMSEAVARRTLPNMFSREKAASWKRYGSIVEWIASIVSPDMYKAASAFTKNPLEKLASGVKKADLITIASYLNKKCDANIVLDKSLPVDEILNQIMTFITTGLNDGNVMAGHYNPSDDAAQAARMRTIINAIDSHFGTESLNNRPQ